MIPISPRLSVERLTPFLIPSPASHKMATLSLPLILGLLLCPRIAVSQVDGSLVFNPKAESGFIKALDRYQKTEFVEARLEFRVLTDLRPTHQRSSASALMLAKSNYKLQEYNLAVASVAELFDAFPNSRYLPEGDLVIGDCRFRQGDVEGAADIYIKVIKGGHDVRLRARAADRLSELVGAKRLSAERINRLKQEITPIPYDEVIQFGQIRWAFRLGWIDGGETMARAFTKKYPYSSFTAQVASLIRTPPMPPSSTASPPGKVKGKAKVAVICPMLRAQGRELRDGILLAKETFSPSCGSLELVFEDSKDDPITSIKRVQKLARDPNIVAIVGDLTSHATVPAAGVANAAKIPLVTPTASEDGIASIGAYIFQLNSTPGMQGRRIADSAHRIGIKTFVILSSLDTYGRHMAEAFSNRVRSLGGEIIAHERYSPGTVDFRNQILRIREVGEALMEPEEEVEPVVELPDSIVEEPDTLRTITSIEGLLVATQSDEEVILIYSQIIWHRIETQMLGGDGWNSPRVSREIGSVVKEPLFVSKYFEDSADFQAESFRGAFRKRFGRAPNVISALGYDAMTCILKAMEGGQTTRETIRAKLSGGLDFEGATGRVLFAPGKRKNSGMYILTIEDGMILPEIISEAVEDTEKTVE